MRKIWATIAAPDEGVSAVLAGEALREAAKAAGQALEIEIRRGGAVLQPIDPREAAPDDIWLAIGDGQGADPRFAGLTREEATLKEVLADAPAMIARLATSEARPATAQAPAGRRRIVAITSCPTGIAHTFMAAEGLTQAAAALGHEIRVETQGSVGAGTPLTPEEIAAADIVLIAADREVDRGRFAGKRVFAGGTKPAITGGQALITRALVEAQMQGGTADAAATAPSAGPYKHLMTGVSFMLPFVVAGGLLIAIAFALGGIYVTEDKAAGTFAHTLFLIGAKGAFTLMVPALAGYIAYSIADRPGIAPGMIGGVLANMLGAGFLGGIAAGFIAGYGTDAMNRWIRLPRTLQGLKPVLILPLLGTVLTGVAMMYVVGTPVASLLAFLTDWLRGMQGSSAILLGLLLGGMMAVDMGGPVNKASYAFSTALISSQIYGPMAATMVGGMTPPLALALATWLFARRFTADEREAAGPAAVLGLAFVTEGAIPFCARDPFRVIPALIAGSALAGGISMAVAAELRVPHGGVFVLPIPGAVTHLAGYVVALVAGTLLSAVLLGLLKRDAAA
ncbi:PTS fructose transporter subunit IIC [Bosea sp. (in: a-proteobacteria)]|uniref:PTS fructose transporter subunit IIC n=1 Tax=Bosea sp. (in: a-proteobacteria) TaxID=1871050 RepID=UPI003B3BDB23